MAETRERETSETLARDGKRVPSRIIGTAVETFPVTSESERETGRRFGQSGSFDHYDRSGSVTVGGITYTDLRAGDDAANRATDLFLRMARDRGEITPEEFISLVRIGTDHRSWEQVHRIGHGSVDVDVSRHAWQADVADGFPVSPDPENYGRAAAPAIGADRVPNCESVPSRSLRAVGVADVLRDERRTGESVRRTNRTSVPFPSRLRAPGLTPRTGERRTVVYRDRPGARTGLPVYWQFPDGRTRVLTGHGTWRARPARAADKRRADHGTSVPVEELPGAAAAAVRSVRADKPRRMFSGPVRAVIRADKRGRVSWALYRRGTRGAIASGRSSRSVAERAIRKAIESATR